MPHLTQLIIDNWEDLQFDLRLIHTLTGKYVGQADEGILVDRFSDSWYYTTDPTGVDSVYLYNFLKNEAGLEELGQYSPDEFEIVSCVHESEY
jgi:hypothetical protein